MGGSGEPQVAPGEPSPGQWWSLVEGAAARAGDVIVLADDRGRTLTRAQFAGAAREVAAALQARGVGPGSMVSWQLPTCLEAAVLLAAVGRLGAAQQPIMPALGAEEVTYLTGLAGTTLFVVAPSWRGVPLGDTARALAAERGFDVLVCDHLAAAPRLALPRADPATLAPIAPAAGADRRRWLYSTSGTSANPKGVWHSDASVLASCPGFVAAVDAGPEDVYPIAFPIAHIGGMCMLGAALIAGHRLVLLDTFDAGRGPQVMSDHRATLLGSAAPFINAYLAAQRAEPSRRLFPGLKACISGGAAKPSGLHDAVVEVLGAPVVSSWGLTEFPLATFTTIRDDHATLAETEGRPVPGVEVRVLDSGELVLRGPQRFVGYADPADDAGAFTDDGWFRTGDLGEVRPNGAVQITGRVKDVIVRNAENISARQVEDVLAGCPVVAEVACVGVPDERTGERVCAVVVPRAGATVTLDDLIQHCRHAGLTTYKWPEAVVVVDALPRSGLGKVAKADLRRAILQNLAG